MDSGVKELTAGFVRFAGEVPNRETSWWDFGNWHITFSSRIRSIQSGAHAKVTILR